jgi:hypothetical protein
MLGKALLDIANERQRQQMVEGWTPEHDDAHDSGEMARAAVCYADPLNESRENPPPKWPWDARWWKPKDRRRDLVRAAALIVAEIERLDRATPSPELSRKLGAIRVDGPVKSVGAK